MNDWTSGYVADINYTYGYYSELNPIRVNLAFLNAGLIPPEFGNACELGFGQGLSTNIHAAASICTWHGTDFNPAQAGFAKELGVAADSNVQLFDEAFAEFAERVLPEFDYIGIHGIWSWISDENRKVIIEFIRKRLKVGGVVYISYNTLPGWGTFAPMRHLMTEHAEIIGADGMGIVNRIDGALDFAEKLLTTNPIFARANPLIDVKIKQIKEQDRNYLAHEYFNRDWHPMHFASMAKWMDAAKLTYACSANYLDFVETANLTSEQQMFLSEIHDPLFKQTVRDFMVNQQFRRDYWVKGARSLTPLEKAERLREQRLLMTQNRSDVVLKIKGTLGEAVLTERIYSPILDLMADHKIRTIAQIEQMIQVKAISIAELIQAVLVLCGNGVFSAVQDNAIATRAKKSTDKLNNHLMYKARSSNEIGVLASPVTGGGVPVARFKQLFLLALHLGKNKPEDWAAFVSEILTVQGQKILKDGKPIESTDEQLTELLEQAHDFAAKQLPILKALQIA
jgi:SAM-dependent methyltransferase